MRTESRDTLSLCACVVGIFVSTKNKPTASGELLTCDVQYETFSMYQGPCRIQQVNLRPS